MFQVVSELYLITASFVRLFVLFDLTGKSTNKYSIEWVTTKIMNGNEIIVYFYWLG